MYNFEASSFVSLHLHLDDRRGIISFDERSLTFQFLNAVQSEVTRFICPKHPNILHPMMDTVLRLTRRPCRIYRKNYLGEGEKSSPT